MQHAHDGYHVASNDNVSAHDDNCIRFCESVFSRQIRQEVEARARDGSIL